jgi:uncharacterized membrane-anchored protein YitT (DUF2179 family)
MEGQLDKTAAMTMKPTVMTSPVSGAGNIPTGTVAINSILYNASLITLGSILCAWAINTILVPHQFLSGGVAGIALIIHYLWPQTSVGSLNFLLNIPILMVGWFYVGRRFMFYSIFGMVVFSMAMEWIPATSPIDDPMLAALLCGIVSGVGCALILKSVGSAGGIDIISVILLKQFSIRLGSTTLFANAAILLVSMVLFSMESILYTLIHIFVTSRVIDLVITGMSKRKAVFIVSKEWKDIQQQIFKQLNRGVTIINGCGGYTGEEANLLYTVVTFGELSRLKALVKKTDPNTFLVVSDTFEVMGHGIGNQPHW